MKLDPTDAPRLLLTALRVPGAAAFLVPRLGAKSFGLPQDADGHYVVRLFAARNLGFIIGLTLSRGDARRLWWQAGIAYEVLDVLAGLLGIREGRERGSAIADTGASTVALGLGVAGLMVDRG